MRIAKIHLKNKYQNCLIYIFLSYIITYMENYKKNIAENLVLLRKKYNYKQSDIAEKLNYSDKTISKWETGEIVPSVENLFELCKLYGVGIEQITSKLPQDKDIVIKKDYSARNKLLISLLSISAVWIMATIIFVYAKILFNYNLWTVFIWAVPASAILGIIFNSLWGKKKLNFVYISILLWSLIACFYLQFLQYNLIALFFIGIPAQVAILLWSGLKKSQK